MYNNTMRAAPKILDDEKNLLNFVAYLGDDMRIIRAGLGLEVRIKLARKVFPKIIVSSRNKAALRKSIMCTPPQYMDTSTMIRLSSEAISSY